MNRKKELDRHIKTAYEVLSQQKEQLRRLLRTKNKIALRLAGAKLPVLQRRFRFDLKKIENAVSEVRGAISWSLKCINDLETERNSNSNGTLSHNPFQKALLTLST